MNEEGPMFAHNVHVLLPLAMVCILMYNLFMNNKLHIAVRFVVEGSKENLS